MPWATHPTASSALTSTHAWRTLRTRVLTRDHHTCQIQGSTCTHTATEVDHITPLSAGGLELDDANAQAVCHPCHHAKTQAEAAAARAARPTTHRPPPPHPGLIT